MELYCTRPHCPRPQNHFAELDDTTTLRTVPHKFCTACGMPVILAGRYLPVKLLGRGGFGAAFLARDRYTPGMRYCVVKQFQPAGNLNPEQLQLAQQLFEREAVVLEDIGHQHDQIPNLYAYFPIIVDSLTSGKQDQFFYIVQEYIDGQNLEEEVVRQGRFTETQALEVLREVLSILKFVHNQNIIHRDIKPSNIMRRRDGKLFLLDFGAVKQVTNSPSPSKGSTGIYSPGFAPLEQTSGQDVYPATDLYALAVTILVLLTAKDASELFDAYSNRWQWEQFTSISPQLSQVLTKMLKPAVADRYQSAQEVLDDLSAVGTSVNTPIPATVIPPAVTPAPVTPQPVAPVPVSPQPVAPVPASPQARFSTWEILRGAGFSGFEGGLVAIALFSLFQSPGIAIAGAVLITGILVYAQNRRWLEGWDLGIIPGLTLAVMLFVPALQAGMGIPSMIFSALTSALIAIAVTSLFRLIYRLLSSII